MNSDNPYASPAADSDLVVAKAVETRSFGRIARETFVAWEKLRLIYVAVLAGVVLLMGLLDGLDQLTSLRLLVIVFEGAVVANLCFFAGPVVDTYVTWRGFHAKWPRRVMFVSGTLFASLLAFAVLAIELFPGMD